MGLFDRKKKKQTDEPVSADSFGDILNGLQHAINSAQTILQNHQVQSLVRMFDTADGSGSRKLVTQPIRVGDRVVDVPLLALVSHHYLAMDHVEVRFKARVGSVESQRIPDNGTDDRLQRCLLPEGERRADLQMRMSGIPQGAGDVMEVCVDFKVQQTPESISRLIDECVKNI